MAEMRGEIRSRLLGHKPSNRPHGSAYLVRDALNLKCGLRFTPHLHESGFFDQLNVECVQVGYVCCMRPRKDNSAEIVEDRQNLRAEGIV
jgi:hypothetical protein